MDFVMYSIYRRNVHCYTMAKILYSLILFLISSTSGQNETRGVITNLILGKPSVGHDPKDVQFLLFPKSDTPNYMQELVYKDKDILDHSFFVPNKLTVIVIHGFLDSALDPIGTGLIKNAYLYANIDANVIIVDWSALSIPLSVGVIQIALGYLDIVTSNIPIVAGRVGDFLGWLIDQNVITTGCVHIIGHSLGAHISGLVGEIMQKRGSGNIWRITGLDPAGPLFDPPLQLKRKIRKEDASFVDVIHSNSGVFGDTTDDGHVDFYVNDGVFQPGCTIPATAIACSHYFSIWVYTTGFKRNIYACACSRLTMFLGICYSPCRQPTLVGPYTPDTTRGRFFLEVKLH